MSRFLCAVAVALSLSGCVLHPAGSRPGALDPDLTVSQFAHAFGHDAGPGTLRLFADSVLVELRDGRGLPRS